MLKADGRKRRKGSSLIVNDLDQLQTTFKPDCLTRQIPVPQFLRPGWAALVPKDILTRSQASAFLVKGYAVIVRIRGRRTEHPSPAVQASSPNSVGWYIKWPSWWPFAIASELQQTDQKYSHTHEKKALLSRSLTWVQRK